MIRLFHLALIFIVSCGCSGQPQQVRPETVAKVDPRAAVKLQVLVVDDPNLAAGIKLLSGEWSERSGGELEVDFISLSEMLTSEKLAADVIIYPSRQLGALVAKKWLRPIRQTVLDSSELDYDDLLPVIRNQSMRLGNEIWALPLGEMPLVLAWYGKVPDKLPRTWDQLDELLLASGFSESEPMLRYPLAAEFISRVVSATSPVDRAALFFDPETMDARLNQPQMVRALEQPRDMDREDSEDVSFDWQVTLPPRKGELPRQLSPLLIASETYNASIDRWEKPTENPPPVICGFSGRLLSVTSTSRNAASAFKLLPWLVGGNMGARLSQQSMATLWFRHSQVSQAAKWLPAQSATENASWLSKALSQQSPYLIPRLPGIEDYLTALEKALAELPPAEALSTSESEWNAITEAHGRQQQREAFRRHLGLPD